MKYYFYCVFLIGVLVLHGDCKVYDPCELAKELYNIAVSYDGKLRLNSREVVDHVPLLVCIAGYHQYDTNFSSYRISKNNGEYRGIFGLPSIDPPSGNATLDLELQLCKFENDFLRIDEKYGQNDRTNYRFFRHICDPRRRFVYAINCYPSLNHYVWSKFKVPVPTKPNMLFGPHPDRPDNLFIPDFDPFQG
uniref:Uncharacterized protein n=1 Tax=Lygus hesperus TaxID=30085 RepID=A0A0K8TIY9_LYGHE